MAKSLSLLDELLGKQGMGVDKKSSVAKQVAAEVPDEINQLLGEIQDLRQEMAQIPRPAPKTEPTEVANDVEGFADFRGTSGDASMEDTLTELKTDPNQEFIGSSAVNETEEEVMDEAHEDSQSESNEDTNEMHEDIGMDQESEGSLTMVLTGNMRLRLKYQAGEQTVSIGFADNALKVELGDGTEFRIPMKRNHLKAA